MSEYVLISIAGIGILSLFCQWLAWWLKLPAILFLLLTGILIGPLLGWLEPDKVFGPVLTPLTMLSVAIILFEGSLTLNFAQVKGQAQVVRNLVTIGLLVTAALTGYLTYKIMQFSWEVSALVGAITAVTGPTVITPLVRSVRPNIKIATILRWEGIIIDPIGALLAVFVFGFIAATRGAVGAGHIVYHFSEMVLTASAFGVVVGYWLGQALRKHWIPDFLHNVATLTIVVAVYTVSNQIDDGTGLLAVTIMGIWLANMEGVPVDELIGFKESLSILLISGLFVILAAQVQFSHLHEIILPATILFLFLQFLVRPIAVALSTLGSSLTWRERALLGWIAPRGIVAAAASALFALRLKSLGITGAAHLVLLCFLIIIGTVVFQSITSRWIARLLGLAEPEPRGVLIIGANRVAQAIAQALREHHFRTLLADRNWDEIAKARMKGLEGYFCNPISAHADRHLDLVGIGYMVALTPQEDLNALSAVRYRTEFGRKNVFSISTTRQGKENKHLVDSKHQGNILFGESITYSKLSNMIRTGAKISSTLLTKNFDFDSYLQKHTHRAIPLVAISPRGHLHFFTIVHTLKPSADWIIISLIPPEQGGMMTTS